MGKTAFANLIVSKLKSAVGVDGATYTSDTPNKAQKAIIDSITEYLTAHTSIKISYNGVLTSGTGVDSVIEDTMKITSNSKTIGKPLNFLIWVNSIQQVIASSFTVVFPGEKGVIVDFKPFNPTSNALIILQTDLLAAHQNNVNTPVQAVWEVICGKILDWLNSELGKNPAATNLPATRTGVSSGIASLISISVS